MIQVFYDGECPICAWEVDLYARADRHGRILWTDITGLGEGELPAGKSREDLLGVFHVRDVLGRPESQSLTEWHLGVDAFARIWRVLPGFRHFAFLFGVPGLRQLAGLGYRLFLKWQSWHRRRRLRQDPCPDRPPAD